MIVNDGYFICKEPALPYSYVHYPAYYQNFYKGREASATNGPFIGFSQTENSEIFFCSCFKKTLENYIQLRRLYEEKNGHIYYSSKYRDTMFNSSAFPFEITKFLVDNHISDDEAVQYIKFRDEICHKCNQATPTATLNYSGYNTFARHYGWYIEKRRIDLGYETCHCVLDTCPDEVKDILAKMALWNNLYNQETVKELGKRNLKLLAEYDKKCSIEGKKLNNIIENYVRDEFSYKKIGEHWVTETLLYKIVKQIFCDYDVVFHYRPSILEGLELDIFVNGLNIGIEYQGVQHFIPVDFWGGERALIKTQEHDLKKRKLCEQNGITLIYFYYTDEIDEKLVRNKLKDYIA